MHGENEFLMLDGVLVSITSHGKRREKERERERERKIKGEASTPVSGSKNSRMQSQR